VQLRESEGKLRSAQALAGLSSALWAAAEAVYNESPHHKNTGEAFKMNYLVPSKFLGIDKDNFPAEWKPYVLNLAVWKDLNGSGGVERCVAAMEKTEKAARVIAGTKRTLDGKDANREEDESF
jgi:hypothetical protein